LHSLNFISGFLTLSYLETGTKQRKRWRILRDPLPGDRILNSPEVESLAMLVFKLPDVKPQAVKAVDFYFPNLKAILMLYIHNFGSLLVSSSYLPPIIDTHNTTCSLPSVLPFQRLLYHTLLNTIVKVPAMRVRTRQWIWPNVPIR
jgi:hypothetical protein